MEKTVTKRKVVIIGAGLVGSSCAFSLVHQSLCEELVLIDVNHERAVGEALDLLHTMSYMPTLTKVKAGTYADCHDANVIIIAAGGPPKPGETRLDSLQTSAKICQAIVPEVMKSGFSGHFLVISNPVDVIAYYVWQLSGLPSSHVLGTGTAIDSARLQAILAQRFGLNPKSVQAVALGEHGDSQMVPWSQVTIANQPLNQWLAAQGQSLSAEERAQIRVETARAGWEIFQRKGTTYYGIAAAANAVVKAILHDEQTVLPVSTRVTGQYGYHDVYLGTPALLGANGVEAVYEVPLTAEEAQQLAESVQTLQQAQASLPPVSQSEVTEA